MKNPNDRSKLEQIFLMSFANKVKAFMTPEDISMLLAMDESDKNEGGSMRLMLFLITSFFVSSMQEDEQFKKIIEASEQLGRAVDVDKVKKVLYESMERKKGGSDNLGEDEEEMSREQVEDVMEFLVSSSTDDDKKFMDDLLASEDDKDEDDHDVEGESDSDDLPAPLKSLLKKIGIKMEKKKGEDDDENKGEDSNPLPS